MKRWREAFAGDSRSVIRDKKPRRIAEVCGFLACRYFFAAARFFIVLMQPVQMRMRFPYTVFTWRLISFRRLVAMFEWLREKDATGPRRQLSQTLDIGWSLK